MIHLIVLIIIPNIYSINFTIYSKTNVTFTYLTGYWCNTIQNANQTNFPIDYQTITYYSNSTIKIAFNWTLLDPSYNTSPKVYSIII
jgi:hypothetical protein